LDALDHVFPRTEQPVESILRLVDFWVPVLVAGREVKELQRQARFGDACNALRTLAADYAEQTITLRDAQRLSMQSKELAVLFAAAGADVDPSVLDTTGQAVTALTSQFDCLRQFVSSRCASASDQKQCREQLGALEDACQSRPLRLLSEPEDTFGERLPLLQAAQTSRQLAQSLLFNRCFNAAMVGDDLSAAAASAAADDDAASQGDEGDAAETKAESKAGDAKAAEAKGESKAGAAAAPAAAAAEPPSRTVRELADQVLPAALDQMRSAHELLLKSGLQTPLRLLRRFWTGVPVQQLQPELELLCHALDLDDVPKQTVKALKDFMTLPEYTALVGDLKRLLVAFDIPEGNNPLAKCVPPPFSTIGAAD
jgi:hypothetical protein